MNNKIKISKRQLENKSLLKSLPLNSYLITDSIDCDFLINDNINVLFLSAKYHLSYPTYIFDRISLLSFTNTGQKTVLLLKFDVEITQKFLLEIHELCFDQNLFLLISHSDAQAGLYLIELNKCTQLSRNKILHQQMENPQSSKIEFLKNFPKIDKKILQKVETEKITIKDLFDENKKEEIKKIGMTESKYKQIQDLVDEEF